MHEMGNHSWYTTVTLRLKGNTTKILPKQRSKGLQTEVWYVHFASLFCIIISVIHWYISYLEMILMLFPLFLHVWWSLSWNQLAMVWERKGRKECQAIKEHQCANKSTSRNCSHLFGMEDIKNSVASRWQKQPPLKTTFTSVLQMKSSSTCLIHASLCEGPIFYFYVEPTYSLLSQAIIWVVMFHSSICWSI
jgi:hypothetical protein